MSEFSTFITSAFDEALTVMGEACTVDGTSTKAVFSQIDVESELTETGYQPGIQLSASISKTDFSTTPTMRATVNRTATNVNYIITSIEENDSGWVLGLLKQV